MQTRENERREFLRRLRNEPLFLARHTGALSAAVCRKLVNRIRRTLAEVHGGRKTWPKWLERRALPRGAAASGFAYRLPQYPPAASPTRPAGLWAVPSTSSAPEDRKDPEEYLAGNRWGFLLDGLLAGETDWQGGVGSCQRWIEARADKTDPAWEPYSSCERVANLLVFLAVMPRPHSGAVLAGMEAFVEESLQWVYRHLEYYGAAETNNHILNNARALAMAGAATANSSAVDAAVRILRQCLPEMILAGGFLRERSSHYQLIVLNWLLDAWRFVAAYRGEEHADARFLRGYGERMVMAAAMLCDGDARLIALVGDVSPDATPAHSSARLQLLYPEFWPAVFRPGRGCEIRDDWFRVTGSRGLVLGNLPAGPYPGGFPTHGHSDPTSFVWRHEGQDMLVDPGRYRYTPDAVSRFQQSAFAHNLPLVNGFAPLCESVLRNGDWRPLPYARAQLAVAPCDNGIVLEHDGFARSTPVMRHRRHISLAETELLVTDSFEGAGSVWLELCWHFAECFDKFDPHRMRVEGLSYELSLSLQGVAEPASVRPACGAEPGGWVSRAYGQRTQAPAVRLGWQVVLPAVVATRFQVFAR
jgi:Heparinase II/III-like protein